MEEEEKPFPTMMFVNEAFLHTQALESSKTKTEIKRENDSSPSNYFSLPMSAFGLNSKGCELETSIGMSNLTNGDVEVKIERNEGECSSLDDSNPIKSESERKVDFTFNENSTIKVENVDKDGFESNAFYPMKSMEDQNQETSSECYEIKQERDEDLPFVTFGHTTNDGSSLVTPQKVSTELNSSSQEKSLQKCTGSMGLRCNQMQNGCRDDIERNDNTAASLQAHFKSVHSHREDGFDQEQTIQTGQKVMELFQCQKAPSAHGSVRQNTIYSCYYETSSNFRSHLKEHWKTNTQEKHCTVKDKAFMKNAVQKSHTRTHSGEDKPYECSICDMAFAQKSNHTGDKSYICTECEKAFSTSADLTLHMKSHTRERRHKCAVCDKAFAQSGSLTAHMRIHTGEKPFKCTFCAKSFTRTVRMIEHMRIHTGEKPYKCTFCDKSFARSSYLTLHMSSHTAEKHHKCTICDKAFAQSGSLTAHLRIHTEEKPFKCAICAKSFVQSTRLTEHISNHTGEKPFKCTLCAKSFTRTMRLTEHMRIHTGEKPYKCTFCDKSFARNSYLNLHMSSHTVEKPYNCTLCDKSFARRSYLTLHMRIHKGKKPYKCTLCDRAFTGNSNRRLHMKCHITQRPD